MIAKTIHTSPHGDITLLRLTNSSGASVVLSTLGAGIIEVNVPDSNGRMDDVVLGYANPADYMADGPCAGKCPGRYANRIAKGVLEIDGNKYSLPINNGPNHLHGGPEGFQNQIWTVVEANDNTVEMQYVSADGEQGYPGTLTATAIYTWTDQNQLKLTLKAQVEGKPTVVNLTNHAYWNLSGHDAGNALKQTLQLNASKYLPTDDTLIPTGDFADVKDTPMDFTSPKSLDTDIHADFPALVFGKGYDNCWVIDNFDNGKEKTAAILTDDKSGRVLTVTTDQPGVQIYTGNWLAGSPTNKAGRPYADYDGVAIECQDFPDAPNKSNFPGTVLRPGEVYCRHITFTFSTKK
ncbi:MAG: galactose mutarotase [Muribaculaceae bacterium]|nr:galactose mutarotase [Muribaculaceae bacterium]